MWWHVLYSCYHRTCVNRRIMINTIRVKANVYCDKAFEEKNCWVWPYASLCYYMFYVVYHLFLYMLRAVKDFLFFFYCTKKFIGLPTSQKVKVLGSKVDKLSKFWSKHRMQRTRLNRIFKIPSHREQMLLSSSLYEKTYLEVLFREFLKLFICLAFSGTHMVSGWLELW